MIALAVDYSAAVTLGVGAMWIFIVLLTAIIAIGIGAVVIERLKR